jgi:hypothetical protein
MLSSSRILALMAALACSVSASPAMAYQPSVLQVPASATKPGRRGLFNDMVLPSSASLYGSKGAGISVAQGKRNARKARNVARNRANHR